jgi:tetratricopeptide (TPR) repeat protein
VLGTVTVEAQTTAPPSATAEAHLSRAAAYQKKSDSQGAVAELKEALILKPDLPAAHGMLGEILLAQGFAEQALPHLDRAGHVQSLAVALMELNRLPDAYHQLVPLYRLRPQDPELLFRLGEISGKLMQEAFDRLIRRHPDSPRARELRARNGPEPTGGGPVEPEKLDELLALHIQNPENPEILFKVGDVSEKIMRQAFTALLRQHPNSARALEFRAQTYMGQQRGDLAEPLFRSALKLNPGLAGAHLALGRIFLEVRGDLDGAEREFRAEVRLRPGDAEATWRHGLVLLKKGQTKEALAELQQSDKLKPNMLETLLELGKAYVMDNQLEQAANVYRHMIEIDDRDELAAAAHLQLSQIYRRMGNAAEADQHLKRVRELNSPTKPNIQ